MSIISLFAQTTAAAPTGYSALPGFIFNFVAIGGIFYFLMIRPQQKQRKAHAALILAMKKGDQVVTAGGIVGEVMHIKENGAAGSSGPSLTDHITIKSGESKLVIVRNRISSVAGSEEAP
jgi:preprotein translocase subunit YajC